MADYLLHLLPTLGRFLRPKHVRWCRCRELPQMSRITGEGREGQTGGEACSKTGSQETKYVLNKFDRFNVTVELSGSNVINSQ